MEINDLKKYLKEIITLESATFEYSQYIAAAEKNAVFHEPKKKEYEEPTLLQYEYKATNDSEPFDSNHIASILFVGSFVGAIAGLMLVGLFGGYKAELSDMGTGAFIGAVVSFFAALIYCLVTNKKRSKKREEMFSHIASVNSKNKNIYNNEMAEYDKKVAEAEEEYKTACAIERHRCDRAEDLVDLFKEQADQINAILNKYYNMDVIFPKYRNISAISSFYEYFETGRCTELSGSDGAYNLYESEKTMGHIVNAVDSIANITAEALNMMKENQYYFYNELHDINYRLSVFNEQLDAFLGDYTKTNDYFLQIADNTKALTYDSAAMLAAFGQ